MTDEREQNENVKKESTKERKIKIRIENDGSVGNKVENCFQRSNLVEMPLLFHAHSLCSFFF